MIKIFYYPRISSEYYKEGSKIFKNVIVLFYNNWNDYGYETTFDVHYFEKDGIGQNIGSIKIYCDSLDANIRYDEQLRTIVPNGGDVHRYIRYLVNSLEPEYCSMGQDINYYRELTRLFPEEYRDILRRLRDLSYDENIFEEFKNKWGVKRSLLRNSSAIEARSSGLFTK